MSNQPPYGYPQGGYQQGGYPSPPPPTSGSGDFAEFLSFRKMITPVIIQIVFWAGVVISIIMGLISIAAGMSQFGNGILVIVGLLYIFIGPVVVRIYCELLILFFRMNESLTEIKNAFLAIARAERLSRYRVLVRVLKKEGVVRTFASGIKPPDLVCLNRLPGIELYPECPFRT